MAVGGHEAMTGHEAASSSSERDLLLRRLADLALLPSGRMTPQERGLIDTVIASAVSRLDATGRRRLAERIAQLPEGPGELTLALARDTIDVAAPVLRSSLALQAGDLVQIIRTASADHQLAIAERKALSAAVVEALIDHASAAAICRMLLNPAAELSTRAMETLVRRSASEPEYQPLLLARPELTMRLAQLMFWWASLEGRKEILGRYSIERRMMHSALDDVLDAGLAASSVDEALHVTLSLVRPPAAMSKAELARLLDLAGMRMRDEFAEEFATAGRIRVETALRIIGDMGGEPVAIYGKALGLSRAQFAELIAALARLRDVDLPGGSFFERITAVFDAISTDRADLVLHCWDWAISAETQIPSET